MDEDSALAIGGYRFTSKNLIVIGLILVGLFLAYVLFHKKPAMGTAPADQAATPTGSTNTGGTVVTSDPSALGSIQTALEAQNQQLAALNIGGLQSSLNGIAATQATQGQTLATINTNANSAARDSAGARTDASIALNEGKQILANQKSGKGSSTNAPAGVDVAHIMASGLGV